MKKETIWADNHNLAIKIIGLIRKGMRLKLGFDEMLIRYKTGLDLVGI